MIDGKRSISVVVGFCSSVLAGVGLIVPAGGADVPDGDRRFAGR
jgi:hypothetical protein